MVLIDTSVWINVFADKQGHYSQGLYQTIGDREIFLTRFQQLELLQGARDEQEWARLYQYLDGQDYLETKPGTWQAAARIYYELRKKGITVRSSIDCCIAQIAMEQKLLLIHDDRDFAVIGEHFPLQHQRWPRDKVEKHQIHEDRGNYRS